MGGGRGATGHHRRFTAWHRGAVERLDVQGRADLADEEYRSWAYAVFCRGGELPAEAFGEALRERQVQLAEQVLGLMTACDDLKGAGVPGVRVDEPDEQFPAGTVMVGNELVHSPLWKEITACVARGVQDHLAEAHWRIWPTCPDHGRGLHVGTARGRAAWWCLAADHRVSWILDPDPGPDLPS